MGHDLFIQMNALKILNNYASEESIFNYSSPLQNRTLNGDQKSIRLRPVSGYVRPVSELRLAILKNTLHYNGGRNLTIRTIESTHYNNL